MREIWFRGKHIHVLPLSKYPDGTWIEGYLHDNNNIYSPKLRGEFLIDPETVGQYTGMDDKNGRKIFEGDIVKIPFESCSFVVEWQDISAAFVLVGDGVMISFDHCWSDYVEVIGNIFDNPEIRKNLLV